MKLISMTDFVLDKYKNAPIEDYDQVNETFINSVIKYAEFLKQPLKLEMFVPCVDNEPFNYSKHGNKKEFEQAKDKVLFENYSVVKQSTYFIVVDSHGRNVWLSWNESKTIESLINEVTEVSLTPNAIKRIFG
ncbi:hypothetical protein HWC92_gp19 [Flavobacterium phage vB_FspS_morran9-1]|uniref:Uncharacterized protein n=16 Tax=Caudoviricetes TaxID=2731619 RepID=A0A6B9LH55_9CAUD|nr:hypothetical protein HWC88_gp06 [Flavobacterium phage vB_FspS_hattifnatt9-1]YP_009854741.1 hypothetical protein HWC89_gp13 [Flavobacterium phage vB_FspS_hemulen6-1]YP_009854872.1 hypothetical protein HWC91_gp17 [Flavobacterium phage vB_FspS_lillamy9-1]YP_009854947.1 hypothetical protein HWC92_gp19 [Flavobacterium phage vB_FspS_morran9-1]YP_009855152.1 hypothetical protein HWC95_gp16 [Flavobacterium phage vB_FspS_sniff9-1]YP_009855225.1 hypothetical protein HWC96_gp15 [Flavobacterium phage v